MNRHTPDARILWSWELTVAAAALPLTVAAVCLWRWEHIPRAAALCFFICIFLFWAVTALIYLPARRTSIRYEINGSHLSYDCGVLFHTRHRMPLQAVRHVTLLQGPLAKRCGFTYLWVGGAGGYVLLEGIPLEEALRIRQCLLSA